MRDIDEWLPFIRWHLNSFCENGRDKPSDFIRAVKEHDMQCWLAVCGDNTVKAVCLTRVLDDRTQTVQVTHCAGEDMQAWAMFMNNIIEWARERGSSAFEAITRPGWERVLKPYGFKKTHVVLEVEI